MMRQIVQNTTQKLVDLLPDNEEYYRLDELSAWGFPSYIVQRTKVELERNMAESMILPGTDWANVESEAVQQAWQQFVEAIRAEARLPASYARAIIETAVVDVLDMLTEPRKNIPDVIYGGDEKLYFEDLTERVEAVVVYPHFAALVPRYMQKKNRDSLERGECTELITQADEKLTAKYSPLNWAQTLAPLFELLDGKIDPSLLKRFFEDKEKQQIAEAFDCMDEPLTRTEFMEVLSSPDLPNSGNSHNDADNYIKDSEEDEQPEPEIETENAVEDTPVVDHPEKMEEDVIEEIPIRTTEEAKLQKKWSYDVYQEGEDEDMESESLVENQEGAEVEPEMDHGNLSEESGPQEDDVVTEDPVNIEKENETHTEDDFETSAIDEDEEDDDIEENKDLEDDAEKAEEHPIWMNFVDDEDQEELEFNDEDEFIPMSFGDTTEQEEVGEYNFETIDFEKNRKQQQEVYNPMEQHLSDRREYFIEEIFGGLEEDYEKAIGRMSDLNDWDTASDFIHNEIFVKNLVNLYSEPAVDFTNRMQNYFKEKNN